MARKKLPIILDQKEVEKLLKQPNKNCLIGLRNWTILKIMLNCGLRVSEITNLETKIIDILTGKFRVVDGKGSKDRDLATPESITEILKEWQNKRPRSDYFFSTHKGKKLCPRYLQYMVKRYSQKAGIRKRITPHTLRHTFATEFYRQTKDIETLRLILGHEKIETTIIYITLANVEVQQSMKAFKTF